MINPGWNWVYDMASAPRDRHIAVLDQGVIQQFAIWNENTETWDDEDGNMLDPVAWDYYGET